MAAIAASGVAGTSAVGIASGLAAIGGVVGGGMVAGTVAVAAAPAVLAGAAGFGAYVVSRKLRRDSAEEVDAATRGTRRALRIPAPKLNLDRCLRTGLSGVPCA